MMKMATGGVGGSDEAGKHIIPNTYKYDTYTKFHETRNLKHMN